MFSLRSLQSAEDRRNIHSSLRVSAVAQNNSTCQAWCGVWVGSRAGHKRLAKTLAMLNQVLDRWVTETGGSTAGATFMCLIKALPSRGRDSWRQLRYKLAREISHLLTPVSTSLLCHLTLSHLRLRRCARARGRRSVRLCTRASLESATSTRKTEAPNLLRAENEDCAVNSDPKTRVHQGPMSNCPTSEAVELRGERTEPLWLDQYCLSKRVDYYTQLAQIKESLTFRGISLWFGSFRNNLPGACWKYWKVTRSKGLAPWDLLRGNIADSASIVASIVHNMSSMIITNVVYVLPCLHTLVFLCPFSSRSAGDDEHMATFKILKE